MSAHAGHSHGSNAGGRRMSTIRITVNIIENDGRLAPPKLADAVRSEVEDANGTDTPATAEDRDTKVTGPEETKPDKSKKGKK